MPLVHLSNQKSFEAPPEASLLDAARQAGLVLAHSCRTGRCGSCKARVLDGQTRPIQPDLYLNPTQHEQGWVLTCASAAASELRLDLEDLGLPVDLQPRTHPCRIDTIERLAPDVIRVRLRLPPTARLRYLAGQYIDVIGPSGLRRSYSVANAPAADGRLELHIRRVPGGAMSDYWFDAAKINDLLRLHGPIGTFFLRDVGGWHLVLLATGTGFAPIQAMLQELAGRAAADHPASVSLYWGGRTAADLYAEPPALPAPDLRFVPVLSRATPSGQGARGHVQQAVLAQPPDWRRTVVYACGSSTMIDSARAALCRAGLAERHFFSDAFVASSP